MVRASRIPFPIWLLTLLLAGCQTFPAAHYVGTNPAPSTTAVATHTAGAAPAFDPYAAQPSQPVVRGQNGTDPQGLWRGYEPQPPTAPNYWNGASGAPAPAVQPNAVQYQPPANPYMNNAAPAAPGVAPVQPSGPPGFVGGSIPVTPNGQTMPVITPGPDDNILPPPGEMVAPEVDPFRTGDVDIYLEETETGRFMFGVGVNSDAGVTGNIVIDERNFDIWRVPRSWDDLLSGGAWRGAGQGLRIEAVPGNQVQRYVINFTEPYLFDSNISFNLSAYYFDRQYASWDENRAGGRVGLGYRLTPDLSTAVSLRGEKVSIAPRTNVSQELNDSAGDHDLFSGRVQLTYDTRDVPFAPTEGSFFEASFEQAFGSFSFPRAEIDYRRHFLVLERPDGSGRQVLSALWRVGITGSQTPVFENFFAGGFSTLRGFEFRGANPVQNGVSVGGEFMFLGSVEYMFPLTADDMLRGVVFCDYGTVEQGVDIEGENFRVAPGLGLRIAVPAMGPAPIALDFAFPVAKSATDQTQVFSFFVGFGR